MFSVNQVGKRFWGHFYGKGNTLKCSLERHWNGTFSSVALSRMYVCRRESIILLSSTLLHYLLTALGTEIMITKCQDKRYINIAPNCKSHHIYCNKPWMIFLFFYFFYLPNNLPKYPRWTDARKQMKNKLIVCIQFPYKYMQVWTPLYSLYDDIIKIFK